MVKNSINVTAYFAYSKYHSKKKTKFTDLFLRERKIKKNGEEITLKNAKKYTFCKKDSQTRISDNIFADVVLFNKKHCSKFNDLKWVKLLWDDLN